MIPKKLILSSFLVLSISLGSFPLFILAREAGILTPTFDSTKEVTAPTITITETTPETLSESDVEPITETASSATVEETPSIEIQKIEETQPFNSDLTKLALANIHQELSKVIDKSGGFSVTNIKQELEKTKSNFSSLRKEFEEKNISPNIIARLDAFQSQYETQISGIIGKLESGDSADSEIADFLEKPEVKIENPTPFRATEFKGEIKKAQASDFPKTALQSKGDLLKDLISSTVFKTRAIITPQETETSNLQPETSITTSNASLLTSYNPSDLGESEEIQFTENLKNLAVSLGNDPLTIFNYVANNIDYVPYYGSKKGADSTLLEKLGNDFDQASLLIGLLRVGNDQGQYQTPARYQQATIKLSVGEVIDLLGVEDPIVAATIFEKTDVPYILYVDQSQNPLFFVVEITYVEAYIDYDYTRGVIQGNPGAPKRWVPLVPFLAKFYKSQHLNALDDMNFDVQTFYENYLNGGYGIQEPIEALESDIQTFLASDPDLNLEDAYVQTYRSEEDLEFLPLTLPLETINTPTTFSAAPEDLKHRLAFSVESSDGSQTLINNSINVSSLANQEILLEYIVATPTDQTVIDSFPSIYDVVPLSLVNLKPVVKINGITVAGGGSTDPEIQMGRENKLKIIFKSPKKDIGSTVFEKIVETIEKSTIAGNTEGIAINTDYIAPPEIRPRADTQTSSAVASQKLWKTAQNFLYRLQSSHDELARITGGRFTNAATRAVVFNGVDVVYQSGEPYSFDWKGLRIDASSVVSYYSHFSQAPNLHQKEFMHLFGLQASLDEADIFEDDYGVESISTVKGLKLINQSQIPGVQVKKIATANESEINSLSISESTKTKLRDAVHRGEVVYVPSSQLTYQSWTGLVYISIDPDTGFGSYIIGEGLNGGYTSCALPGQSAKSGQNICVWDEGIASFLQGVGLLGSVSANIISPTNGQQFTQGDIIHVQINYSAQILGLISLNWTETEDLSTSNYALGAHIVRSHYDSGQTISIIVKAVPNPLNISRDYIFPKCDGGIAGNCDEGNRKSGDITQIVIHYTGGGNANGAKNEFWRFDKPLSDRTSAHYIIERNGTAYQIVQDEDLAWHAGRRSRSPSTSYTNSSKTISIEIVNWGWVTSSGGKYYNYNGAEYRTGENRQVYDNSTR